MGSWMYFDCMIVSAIISYPIHVFKLLLKNRRGHIILPRSLYRQSTINNFPFNISASVAHTQLN